MRFHADGGLQAMQDALDDVHPNAAAGDLGDLLGGAEAGAEDEIESLGFGETRGLFGGGKTEFDGFGTDFLRVDAAAIVGDFDDNLVAVVVRVEADASMRRLAQLAALFGGLNAVAHGVAHEMRQRFGDRVENAFVEVGLLPAEDEFDLAAALARDVAHHAGEAPE